MFSGSWVWKDLNKEKKFKNLKTSLFVKIRDVKKLKPFQYY